MGQPLFLPTEVQELHHADGLPRDNATPTRFLAVGLRGTTQPPEQMQEITGRSQRVLMRWYRK
jgi:hypothetical protein